MVVDAVNSHPDGRLFKAGLGPEGGGDWVAPAGACGCGVVFWAVPVVPVTLLSRRLENFAAD